MDEATYKAHLRALELSLQIEKDFRSVPKGPTAMILHKAQEGAVLALAKLVVVDPYDPTAIIPLQNEVRRFKDMVEFVTEAVQDGKESSKQISDEDADDLAQTVGLTEIVDA